MGSSCNAERHAARARGGEAAALVGHEKERLPVGPRFASSSSARGSADRGQRRGLDGPSMPKTL